MGQLRLGSRNLQCSQKTWPYITILEERKQIALANIEVLFCGFGRRSREGKESEYRGRGLHEEYG